MKGNTDNEIKSLDTNMSRYIMHCMYDTKIYSHDTISEEHGNLVGIYRAEKG